MLFNSYEFIFLFLPVAIGGYFFFGRRGTRPANIYLALASLFFYGWWDVRYLPLLLGSIAGNYLLSGAILRAHAAAAPARARAVFLLGLAANLGLLCYYKYLGFLLGALRAATGADLPALDILLPLGISFFTITQILYLYDCCSGTVRDHSLGNYALFVSFFPHLMAGPILYHRQMMRQFADDALHHPQWENIARGLTLFIIGLAKKVLIADAFLQYVNPAFQHTADLTLLQAWLAMLCYLCQLFFDFSGYSDMAVGLARMMNFTIPVNFNAPYRAASLITFWQRWHISLTNALTACVYMPILQHFRHPGLAATTFAASFTLFLVGIWHGAGWQFVIFAALNALGIAINYVWRQYRLPMPAPLGHALTILFVLVAMVFFRAGSAGDAWHVLAAMTGAHGIGTLAAALPALPKKALLVALALIAFAPPSQQIARRMQPRWPWLLAAAALFLLAVTRLGAATDFLYFQF
ncbi:MBOAT family protein [uncultured Selenomonas sp.]|uniref:MBOAT family O-acyltransferase n=1 Tax=uncultured Selenomonas sp. TaxID=159275 RepID=UPI0025FC2738|nr:MBOAT family O-acyltransferase [uncultured Selenomonas sp.]